MQDYTAPAKVEKVPSLSLDPTAKDNFGSQASRKKMSFNSFQEERYRVHPRIYHTVSSYRCSAQKVLKTEPIVTEVIKISIFISP